MLVVLGDVGTVVPGGWPMSGHNTETQLWATEREREVEGKKPAFVRWYCICGRLGDAVPIDLTRRGKSAHRRASDGGIRHCAAMERGQ